MLSGTNLGLIAMFAGVILVMGGIALANSQGWFSDAPSTAEGVKTCDEVIQSGTQGDFHEHAKLEVYLSSDQPYDFSPEKYQVAASFVHFEGGPQDANGATIHVHASRPTLGCLFETIGWTVGPNKVVTDTGEEYVVDENHELRVLENGQPADRGWNQPIVQDATYVIEYTQTSGSTGNGTSSSASSS